MTQDDGIDALIRLRIRGLRLARGWSLDALAARCHLSASSLSRIETGHRRISVDQLVILAKALGTTIDQLVETVEDDDVVVRAQQDEVRGVTTWQLAPERAPHGLKIARMRMTQPPPPEGPGVMGVHPGRDWFTVLSGTVRLQLGERTITVATGDAAEFSTMVPHAVGADEGTAEILLILTADGERTHLHAEPAGG